MVNWENRISSHYVTIDVLWKRYYYIQFYISDKHRHILNVLVYCSFVKKLIDLWDFRFNFFPSPKQIPILHVKV